MIQNTLKKFSFFILLFLASVHLSAYSTEVSTEKIQQFVDVYKKIKDHQILKENKIDVVDASAAKILIDNWFELNAKR